MFLAIGLGEGFEMRWCTISAEETSKCKDFKSAIDEYASNVKLSVDFSCVQGSKAVDCMKKIMSGNADLITLDGGEIFTAGKMYEMVPIVGEVYDIETPTTSYFAVAVARKNSSITFKTLKGKKSCHTGAGKTSGWNVPVGLLLSKNIMQTDKSCNAYTAAGKFFSESCVPNVKTSTYDPKKANPYNLCALCKDECSKNGNYSGYSGAFKCLKDGVGDVAFVKHTTVPSAEASSYVYLCKDGTTKDTYKNCYLAKVPSHAVMVKKGNANNANYRQLLVYASKVAGITQNDPTQFQLFNSSKYKGKDLLFKDSTKQLVDVKDKNTYEKWLGTDYLEDLKALTACPTTPRPTAGGKNNMLELLSAMISFIALFYTGALFK